MSDPHFSASHIGGVGSIFSSPVPTNAALILINLLSHQGTPERDRLFRFASAALSSGLDPSRLFIFADLSMLACGLTPPPPGPPSAPSISSRVVETLTGPGTYKRRGQGLPVLRHLFTQTDDWDPRTHMAPLLEHALDAQKSICETRSFESNAELCAALDSWINGIVAPALSKTGARATVVFDSHGGYDDVMSDGGMCSGDYAAQGLVTENESRLFRKGTLSPSFTANQLLLPLARAVVAGGAQRGSLLWMQVTCSGNLISSRLARFIHAARRTDPSLRVVVATDRPEYSPLQDEMSALAVGDLTQQFIGSNSPIVALGVAAAAALEAAAAASVKSAERCPPSSPRSIQSMIVRSNSADVAPLGPLEDFDPEVPRRPSGGGGTGSHCSGDESSGGGAATGPVDASVRGAALPSVVDGLRTPPPTSRNSPSCWDALATFLSNSVGVISRMESEFVSFSIIRERVRGVWAGPDWGIPGIPRALARGTLAMRCPFLFYKNTVKPMFTSEMSALKASPPRYASLYAAASAAAVSVCRDVLGSERVADARDRVRPALCAGLRAAAATLRSHAAEAAKAVLSTGPPEAAAALAAATAAWNATALRYADGPGSQNHCATYPLSTGNDALWAAVVAHAARGPASSADASSTSTDASASNDGVPCDGDDELMTAARARLYAAIAPTFFSSIPPDAAIITRDLSLQVYENRAAAASLRNSLAETASATDEETVRVGVCDELGAWRPPLRTYSEGPEAPPLDFLVAIARASTDMSLLYASSAFLILADLIAHVPSPHMVKNRVEGGGASTPSAAVDSVWGEAADIAGGLSALMGVRLSLGDMMSNFSTLTVMRAVASAGGTLSALSEYLHARYVSFHIAPRPGRADEVCDYVTQEFFDRVMRAPHVGLVRSFGVGRDDALL